MSFLRADSNGVYLQVKLQPRASRSQIGTPLGDELRIKVTAPPVDAAANQALLELLAQTLRCSKGAVQLVRGHTSRHKLVYVRGVTTEQVEQRLSSGPSSAETG